MINAQYINHIGVAVKSIEAARAFYERTLGLKFEGIEEVPEQKVKVAFFSCGQTRIELLEPTTPDSTVAQFIEKRGEGIHHLAYTVDNLQERIDQLKAQGIRMIDEKPRKGAHHNDIAFIHPKSSAGILTEICEPKKNL